MSRLLAAGVALAVALWVFATVPPSARAQETPADSSLHRFLQGLSGSTDRYFGTITAPLDTAGLDSALAVGVRQPWLDRRAGSHFSYGPVYAFNRVDGTMWSASMGLSSRR